MPFLNVTLFNEVVSEAQPMIENDPFAKSATYDGAQPMVMNSSRSGESFNGSMDRVQAQPMVENIQSLQESLNQQIDEYLAYDSAWMLNTNEGELHYCIWVHAESYRTEGMTMREEDAVYIRELELVSLRGC